MTRPTQALLLAFLGAVLLRMSLSDAYLRYVTEWMKWPILASGVFMLALAVGPLFLDPDGEDKDGDHHGHGGVPRATWLLLLPGLIVFVISPPELGSFVAERRANQSVPPQPAVVADLSAEETNQLPLYEFVWRAQGDSDSLIDRTVELTGFVTHGGDHWYVTRLSIGCCAADALAFRVRVDDPDRPPRDQWVRVTGSYVEGTGTSLTEDPVLHPDEVVEIDKPRQTYE